MGAGSSRSPTLQTPPTSPSAAVRCAAALQVKDVRHLPAAILGTVGVACLMYVMLALALAVLAYPNISCPADALIPPFPPPLVNFISAFVGGHGGWLGGWCWDRDNH